MKIKKVFNNNVVLTANNSGQELVVMGRGLAFQKRQGNSVDESNVEKTFILERDVSGQLAELLKETPDEYLHLSLEILEMAKSTLPYKLDDYLYVALTDHLSFAISRYEKGMDLKNPLSWEIRKYYKQEYGIALQALDIIKDRTGVRLPEDEASSIALHLVNAQISGENMAEAMQVTEMVNDIINIVKYHFQTALDESSINFERFVTHLRFFAIRFIRNESAVQSEDDFLYQQVKERYVQAFQCTEKIAVYLDHTYDWKISREEKIYLTLHIRRVINRQEPI